MLTTTPWRRFRDFRRLCGRGTSHVVVVDIAVEKRGRRRDGEFTSPDRIGSDPRTADINTADQCFLVRGKGRKERQVPMPALLETTLVRYLRLERPRSSHTDRIFVVLQGKRRGHPMTVAGLRSLFRARRREVRLHNANPHRLRHTFGTDMARAGVSLAVLQRLMGHVYPETTMRYVALSMRDINNAYYRALDTIERQRS